MKLAIAFFVVMAPLAFAAKVYQYKDANGNLVFTDVPPAEKSVTSKDVKGNSIQTSGGGYTLNQAMRNYPVVLWTNSCGKLCDDARDVLRKRGIPYSVRNPESAPSEREALLKLTGDTMVPVLQVGSDLKRGFEESSWQAALDQAGYPKTPDPTARNLMPNTQPPAAKPDADTVKASK